jgi:DNA-binding response OmpR family regulator
MKTSNLNIVLPGGKLPQFRRSRILAIEDDNSLCEILEVLFYQSGYECLIVQETTDITGLMQEFKPDLVLIDYLLPKINGGELCSQIKQNSLFARIPVIIYSAYSRVLLSLGNYGCDYFLAKPFDLDDLTRNIEVLLSRPVQNTNFGFAC